MLEAVGYEAPLMSKTAFENTRGCIEVFYISEGLFLIEQLSQVGY